MSAVPVLESVPLRISRGNRLVLDCPPLRLEGGGLVALLGPNGAGKTTLLKALAGLLAEAAAVTLDGVAIADMTPRERARRLAYLAQAEAVHWPLTAHAVVSLGRFPHGDGARGGKAAVARAMAATSTTAFAGRPVATLSGGERARVLLARALAVEAPVLIVDEPDAALDPRHQIAIFDVLAAEAGRGRLVIAAFHDLALAERYGNRVIVLAAGRPVADGPPEEALRDEIIRDVFGMVAHGNGRFGPRWQLVPETRSVDEA